MSNTDSFCLSSYSSCEELATAQLLGTVWNWCLYGALVVQFYVYSYNFSQDNKYIKRLVYSIFFLETVQTVLSGTDLYYWFASGFGDIYQLTTPFASFIDLPMMGSVVALSVQFFFAHRIFKLSEKRSGWLCVIICLISIVSTFGAFTVGYFMYLGGSSYTGKIPLEETLSENLDIISYAISPTIFELTWLIGNTITDLLITFAMLYHLRKFCTIDGNLNRHILVRAVRLTVETNLMTTTVSIVALVMFAAFPESNWYMCPTYILGKLYSNTLLVSLNNRIAISDSYEAPSRGPVVNCQVMKRFESSARQGLTADNIILEPEDLQEHSMNELAGEAKVEERVNTPTTIYIV